MKDRQVRQAIGKRAGRIGDQLAGKLFRRGQVLFRYTVGYERAQGWKAEFCVPAQPLQRGARFSGNLGVRRVEADDGEIELVKLIGRFQTDRFLKMRVGFRQLI